MNESRGGRLVCAATPALVTVPGVEILEVGEDWECSTGVFTFTHEDLQSAIASQDDPAIRTPVLKLGHIDPRFDGQPAVGRAGNLRLTNNEQTLVCDYIGVPLWLAECMGSAYPRRSIEGAFEYTPQQGNEKWPFILSAVALLGSFYPAISTLEDVQALFGIDAPPLFPVGDVPEVAASGDLPGLEAPFMRMRKVEMPLWGKKSKEVAAAAPPAPAPAASVPLDSVRRTYYETLDGPGQWWWWIREVRVDPLQLVVDDDDGHLFLVDVTVNGEEITFGEAVEVKIEYVAAKCGPVVAASYADPVAAGRVHVRASGDEPTNDAPINQPPEEGDVKLTEEALSKLGLPADASEDDINAAILRLSEGSPPAGDTVDTPPAEPAADTTTPPAGDVPGTTGDPAPATPTATPELPDGLVVIDEATLNELKQGATTAQQLQEQQVAAARNKLLDDAVRAGKFPVARRPHYEALMTADPEGTSKLIASLSEGVIPVSERGTAGGGEESVEATAYPDAWAPSVNATRRGVGSRLKVVGD